MKVVVAGTQGKTEISDLGENYHKQTRREIGLGGSRGFLYTKKTGGELGCLSVVELS